MSLDKLHFWASVFSLVTQEQKLYLPHWLAESIKVHCTFNKYLPRVACMRAKSLQPCLTLHDPMDCSPQISSVHGIFPARLFLLSTSLGDLPDPGMEAMSPTLACGFFATEPAGKPDAVAKSLQSCPTLCDPIDAAHQAPPSLGFSRQEHCSGLPFPSPMHESEK